MQNKLNRFSIKEAVNNLSSGLCFSDENGQIILANRMINELAYQLTVRTLIDPEYFWGWLAENGESDGSSIVYLSENGQAYEFRREVLYTKERKRKKSEKLIQMTAEDITELYLIRRRLQEGNEKLLEQNRRQESLMSNIADINRKQELLSMKMHIHGALGNCVTSTARYLDQKENRMDAKEQIRMWKDILNQLGSIQAEREKTGSGREEELQKVAAMIGCKVIFEGERPRGERAAYLYYAAVREALTNAVRHAKADRLYVKNVSGAEDQVVRVEISDNGIEKAEAIREGNGLTNLRERLLQDGVGMEICCRDGVELTLLFPAELYG